MAAETERIPLFRPCFDEPEEQAAVAAMRSGWMGFGPQVPEFEERFRRFVGSQCAVGTASGTWALRLALRTLPIKGRKVITTPLTFIATAQAILAEGGSPIFADVDDRGLLDPESVRALLDLDPAAVVTVHLGGFAGDLAGISKLCHGAGVHLIEDCAHAAGSTYQGQHLGTFGTAGAFSFHAVKPLAMGEGGALVTNAVEIAHRASRLRWFGIDRDTFERDKLPGSSRWRYDINELGEKAYLDNLHAAIGIVQLNRISELQARRAFLASRYQEALADIDGLKLPVAAPEESPSWHLYQIRTAERDDLAAHLDRGGITTGVHYPLVTAFRALRRFRRSTPNAERISSRLLSLPLHPRMENQHADRVIDAVRSFFLGSV